MLPPTEAGMITHELLTDQGILTVHPISPLTADDFEGLARDLDPWLEQHGPLKGLMIQAEAFPGWNSLAGMLSHFRFVRDHHRRIGRVAMVSDSAVLTLAPKIADHFVAAEVRHFPADRHAEALAWLQEPADAQ
jgi:hypothetical protein